MTLTESVVTGGWRHTRMVQAGPRPSWQMGILGEPGCQRQPLRDGERGSRASHHRGQLRRGKVRPPHVVVVAWR